MAKLGCNKDGIIYELEQVFKLVHDTKACFMPFLANSFFFSFFVGIGFELLWSLFARRIKILLVHFVFLIYTLQ